VENRISFLVPVIAFVVTCVPLVASSSRLPELLDSHPCFVAIERRLELWGATDEILKGPGGPLGGDVYRIATKKIGVWVTLHLARSETTVSLFLTDAEGSTRLDFGAACSPAPMRTPAARPSSSERSFTDADLHALLDSSEPLVVFLWSPHLPLSADGYREIEAATTALDLTLAAVVDPSANPSYVAAVGDDVGIPESARHPLTSVELLFRDLAVHAPTILIFANGKASAPLPGYRNSAAYREHIGKFLESSRR